MICSQARGNKRFRPGVSGLIQQAWPAIVYRQRLLARTHLGQAAKGRMRRAGYHGQTGLAVKFSLRATYMLAVLSRSYAPRFVCCAARRCPRIFSHTTRHPVAQKPPASALTTGPAGTVVAPDNGWTLTSS